MKAVLIIVIVAAVSAASFVTYTLPHCWLRVGTAEARPSTSQTNVTVYKSSEGNFLFEVKEDSLVGLYIFYPATNQIGIPNLDQFVFLPGLVYSKDVPVPVVYADNRAKVETDLNILVENEALQFTHAGRRRIVADLKSY